MTGEARAAATTPGLVFREARAEDIPACAEIWRISISDYIGRLGQAELPREVGPLTRLYAHLQSTDPERFIVAERRATRRRSSHSARLPSASGCGICRCCSSCRASRDPAWGAS